MAILSLIRRRNIVLVLLIVNFNRVIVCWLVLRVVLRSVLYLVRNF